MSLSYNGPAAYTTKPILLTSKDDKLLVMSCYKIVQYSDIGLARILSGCTFSSKKLMTFFSRRPQETL